MNANVPQLTVIMACYNAALSLNSAVQSIIDQTFSDFQFIIVDDGSSDETYRLLKKWKTKDERIIILKNEKNAGLSASLNRAIDSAQTPLIARMDADDEALPTRLEEQMIFMQNHPEVDILGTGVLTRPYSSSECIGKILMPTSHPEIVSRIFKKSLVLHPTILIKADVYKNVGTYDNTVRWAEDADLWYRIYDQVTWANLEKPLLKYTVKQKLTKKIITNNLQVKFKNLKRRGLLISHSPILIKDILYYSFISIGQILHFR